MTNVSYVSADLEGAFTAFSAQTHQTRVWKCDGCPLQQQQQQQPPTLPRRILERCIDQGICIYKSDIYGTKRDEVTRGQG